MSKQRLYQNPTSNLDPGQTNIYATRQAAVSRQYQQPPSPQVPQERALGIYNSGYRQIPVRTDQVDKILAEASHRLGLKKNSRNSSSSYSRTNLIPVNNGFMPRQRPNQQGPSPLNQHQTNQTTNIQTPKESQKTAPSLSQLIFQKPNSESIAANAFLYEESFKNQVLGASPKNIGKSLQSKLNPFIKLAQTGSIKPKVRTKRRSKLAVAVSLFLFSLMIFGGTATLYYQKNVQPITTGNVAGASEISSEYPKFEEYKSWITEKNEVFDNPENDLDSDGLTNYEEFLVGTDPKNANTCSPTETDGQNLFNLINPKTCKPIDPQNEEELKQFDFILSIPHLQEKILKSAIYPTESDAPVQPETVATQTLLTTFGVESYAEIDAVTIADIDAQLNLKKQKQSYLETIKKIDSYIKNNRSYESYDRNYSTPVHPAVYLDTSLKYNVPLKYMLAIARAESRFGTDRYTQSGNLTRPGQYQNIYSLGLVDSGANFGFQTWEEGVEAFGKWYQKFQARGVPDCNKWRIFNPNGDYCSKIETLANQIEVYLQA